LKTRHVVAWFLSGVLTAAAPPKEQRTQIRIPVWVKSPAEDVTTGGFEVRIGGDPVRIVRTRGPRDDLLLLLIWDLTGEITRVEAARKALAGTLEALPRNAWISLLRAQDGLQVRIDPTPDRAAIMKASEALAPGGKAGLLDTLEDAARLADGLLTRVSPRVAVLYLTDSNIYNYREDFANPVINASDSRDLSRAFPEGLVRERISRLVSQVEQLTAPVFIYHLDYRSDRLNEAYQSGLMQLASISGGSAEFARSIAEIQEGIARIVNLIASHWSLDVDLGNAKGEQLQVTVSRKDGPEEISHRQRYVVKGLKGR